MITKILLPNENVLDSPPKAEGWSYKENLGHLAVAGRVAFDGAGSLDSGVFTISANETVSIYYPLLPGHLYRLSGTVSGSASLTVTLGGTAVGTWTAGSNSGTVKPTAGSSLGVITLVEGATQAGTITDLMLVPLQTADFSIAHQN